MHKVIGIFLMITILYSCHHTPVTATRISGKLTDMQDEPLVLIEMGTNSMLAVDSVVQDTSGIFNFEFHPKEAGFWLLRAKSGKVLVIVVNPGDQIVLSGSGYNFPESVNLNGPPEVMALHAFYKDTRKEEQIVDSVESELALHQDDDDYVEATRKADTVFRQIWERQREREIRYINSHPDYLSTLVVLNYAFGMSPVLNPEDDFALYEKLDSSLVKSYSKNKHVQYHHSRVQEHGLSKDRPVH